MKFFGHYNRGYFCLGLSIYYGNWRYWFVGVEIGPLMFGIEAA